KNARIRESHPIESQSGRLTGLPVITKSRLHRVAHERPQIRIHFLHIHAFESAGLVSRHLDRSRALNKDLASFALRGREPEHGNASFCIGDRRFEGNEKLMALLIARKKL